MINIRKNHHVQLIERHKQVPFNASEKYRTELGRK